MTAIGLWIPDDSILNKLSNSIFETYFIHLFFHRVHAQMKIFSWDISFAFSCYSVYYHSTKFKTILVNEHIVICLTQSYWTQFQFSYYGPYRNGHLSRLKWWFHPTPLNFKFITFEGTIDFIEINNSSQNHARLCWQECEKHFTASHPSSAISNCPLKVTADLANWEVSLG